MGVVRTILALSVMVWHLNWQFYGTPYSPIANGSVCVICFYIISGFYMSMVLDEKYIRTKGGIPKFYLSRIARLYPGYFFILLASLVAALVLHMPTNLANITDPTIADTARDALVLSNIVIFGIDIFYFYGIGGPGGGIVSMAVTVCFELYFYIFAPVLAKMPDLIIVILFGLALRLRLHFLHSDYETWRYYYAPSLGCFFLMGVLSYRFSKLVPKDLHPTIAGWVILLVPFFWGICGISRTMDLDVPQFWAFYAFVAFGTPFIFSTTRHSRWDAVIGDISYPLYLVHLPIIELFKFEGPSITALIPLSYFPLAAAIASLLAALLLGRLVDAPMRRFRSGLSSSGRDPAHSEPTVVETRLAGGSNLRLVG